LTITDAGGAMRSALTNQFGYYPFFGFNAGEIYILSVKGKGYAFDTETQF
jgi:hypothetical protein